MANSNTLQVIANGPNNVIIRASQVSDGTVDTTTVYNATSTGAFGVNVAGQVFYPGIYTKLVGLDYDVQDMKISIQWEATADQDILPLGSAPEDFNFRKFGGIRVPAGLAGATGSIKIKNITAAANSTYFVILYLTKNVPQS